MSTPTDSDAGATLSIEDFAASIVASLAESAAPEELDDDLEPRSPDADLPLRERVRKRTGRADLLVFRVADELFAMELAAVEEALDMPEIHALPEMPDEMLGVFTHRAALVSVFAPHVALGVRVRHPSTAVVLCAAPGERRIALATDDVDDVLAVDLATVHDAPGTNTKDGSLLGIVHRGADLIALLDADAVATVHRPHVAALPDLEQEQEAA